MDKKQYNNIINWTLKHEKTLKIEDNISIARAIFNNMGVALPQGKCQEIANILESDDYMGWKSCTAEEAQAAANKGTAAIAVSDDELIIVAAEDEEEPITDAASVMTLATTSNATSTVRYYSYSNGTTTMPKETLYFNVASINQNVGWNGYVPFDGYIYSSISWNSSNSQVALVDDNGMIEAVGVGEARITVRTDSGLSDSFVIKVQPYGKCVRVEKTIFGASVGDIVAAQAYRVHFNLSYAITKKSNGRVFVSEIDSFANYDKGNMMAGLEYPHLEIGRLTIGDNTYSMQPETNDILSSPTWVYDAKEKVLNQWFDEGVKVTNLAILMLDAALFPYRQVEIETTLDTN